MDIKLKRGKPEVVIASLVSESKRRNKAIIATNTPPQRMTRSVTKEILKETLECESKKQDENLVETSTDLSKEEYVKSYSLQPRGSQKDRSVIGSEKSDSHKTVPMNDVQSNADVKDGTHEINEDEHSKGQSENSLVSKDNEKEKSEDNDKKGKQPEDKSTVNSDGEDTSSDDDDNDDTVNDPDYTVPEPNLEDTLTADDANIPTEEKEIGKAKPKKKYTLKNKPECTASNVKTKKSKKKEIECEDDKDSQPGTSDVNMVSPIITIAQYQSQMSLT